MARRLSIAAGCTLALALGTGCSNAGKSPGHDGGGPDPHPPVGACNDLPAAGQWQSITPAGIVTADALALDPFELGTIWLGADPNGGATKGLGGVWKSSDCGANWSHVNSGMNGALVDGAHIWSMALDYVDRGTIYVIGQYGPQGLWKSTNGGVDWTQLLVPGGEVANAAPAGPGNPTVAAIGSISMDPTDHLHLIAGTHANCTPPHAPLCQVETRDGGATWSIVDVKIPGATGWIEQAGPYVLDANTTLYATMFNGLWLSSDSGASWQDVTPPEVMGATGGEYTHRPFLRSAGGKYYLPGYANQNGLLESSDGKSWSHIAGSPRGAYELGFATGNGKLYLGDFYGKDYEVASESAPSSWAKLPTPPFAANLQGPQSMEYDEAHHVLYSSNFSGGLWRMVTP
jgi:hypothetical protein